MIIKDNFKLRKKVIQQKDIILNHCFRVAISNDAVTNQFFYLGDMTKSIEFDQEIDELESLNVYSSFEKYFKNILIDTIQFEEIFLLNYSEMQVGYKVISDNLIIFGYTEDEFLMLVLCNQKSRSKTIYGAFKNKQFDYALKPANLKWRLIDEY